MDGLGTAQCIEDGDEAGGRGGTLGPGLRLSANLQDVPEVLQEVLGCCGRMLEAIHTAKFCIRCS